MLRAVASPLSDGIPLSGQSSLIISNVFRVISIGRQPDELFEERQHLFAMAFGVSDAFERGGENSFDLVRSFPHAFVVGDKSQKGKFEYVLQVSDGSESHPFP